MRRKNFTSHGCRRKMAMNQELKIGHLITNEDRKISTGHQSVKMYYHYTGNVQQMISKKKIANLLRNQRMKEKRMSKMVFCFIFFLCIEMQAYFHFLKYNSTSGAFKY